MPKYPLAAESKKNGLFITTGAVMHGPVPNKITKVSENEVCAVYGKYKQTWTAEGSGNERYNFVETITEVSANDS